MGLEDDLWSFLRVVSVIYERSSILSSTMKWEEWKGEARVSCGESIKRCDLVGPARGNYIGPRGGMWLKMVGFVLGSVKNARIAINCSGRWWV